MTPIDVLRSRRKPISKLVYSYVMACGQCHDDDETLAAFFCSDADTVTTAVSALIADKLLRMTVRGHRVLMLASDAPTPGPALEDALARVLAAMESTLQVYQIKPKDRATTSEQAGILADAEALGRICANLAAWQAHARQHVWPFRLTKAHVFTLAEVLANLQEIAEFRPSKIAHSTNRKDANSDAGLYL